MTSNYDLYSVYLTENVITPFYQKRLEKLNELALNDVLQRKNPNLWRRTHIIVTVTSNAFARSYTEGQLVKK